MNFEEWYLQYNDEERPRNNCENAWEACKNEVLKILKSQDHFIGDGIKTCIKEIEKL
ncbi:MAG: hypothetical protein AABY22_19200 [Nanoarchaeota archaeon]